MFDHFSKRVKRVKTITSLSIERLSINQKANHHGNKTSMDSITYVFLNFFPFFQSVSCSCLEKLINKNTSTQNDQCSSNYYIYSCYCFMFTLINFSSPNSYKMIVNSQYCQIKSIPKLPLERFRVC